MPQLGVLIPGILVALLILYIIRSYWPQKRTPKHLDIYQAGYKSYNAPNGDQFLIHVHKSDATPELRKAVAVGAVLSEQNRFVANRIETGASPEQSQEWLASSWNIRSAPDARHEIQHLFDAGHRVILDRVAELGQTLPETDITASLIQEFEGYPVEDLQEFAENFAETGPRLVQLGRLAAAEDLPTFGTIGYDLGRAVTVSRVCAAAGILSNDEAEAYCTQALQIVEHTFPTWSSFATSYLAGRALWGSVNNPSFPDMVEMVSILLEQELSPWVELPLRP